ncbi:MAG: hypothetical protein D6720_01215 [Gammaproteobacteria bacterium]|nr:MAG: hypothetical protein D6720_01215 [Gammaproteobacteria bacterium]
MNSLLSDYNPLSMRIRLGQIAVLLLVLASQQLHAGRCDGTGNCLFGVFPHTGTRQLLDTYATLAEELSLVLDSRVRLASSSSMGRFQDELAAGRWDIALVGPGQFIYYAEPAGYIPLATTERLITYRIVTLQRTHIRTLAQLRGHRLGLMWPHTGTWLVTKALLHDAQIDPRDALQTRTFASQRACIHALLIGLVDACGLATPIFKILEKERPAPYLTLSESTPHAGAVYLAHPEVDPERRQALAEYLQERPGLRPAKPEYWEHYRELARRLGVPPR